MRNGISCKELGKKNRMKSNLLFECCWLLSIHSYIGNRHEQWNEERKKKRLFFLSKRKRKICIELNGIYAAAIMRCQFGVNNHWRGFFFPFLIFFFFFLILFCQCELRSTLYAKANILLTMDLSISIYLFVSVSLSFYEYVFIYDNSNITMPSNSILVTAIFFLIEMIFFLTIITQISYSRPFLPINYCCSIPHTHFIYLFFAQWNWSGRFFILFHSIHYTVYSLLLFLFFSFISIIIIKRRHCTYTMVLTENERRRKKSLSNIIVNRKPDVNIPAGKP